MFGYAGNILLINLTTKNISPMTDAIVDIPTMASTRNNTSPSTRPPIKNKEAANPSETALATAAKTPGPGVAANTTIPNKNARRTSKSIVALLPSSTDSAN